MEEDDADGSIRRRSPRSPIVGYSDPLRGGGGQRGRSVDGVDPLVVYPTRA